MNPKKTTVYLVSRKQTSNAVMPKFHDGVISPVIPSLDLSLLSEFQTRQRMRHSLSSTRSPLVRFPNWYEWRLGNLTSGQVPTHPSYFFYVLYQFKGWALEFLKIKYLFLKLILCVTRFFCSDIIQFPHWGPNKYLYNWGCILNEYLNLSRGAI